MATITSCRRNGRLWACDECRGAKVGCNHQRPCGRCARLSRHCTYTYKPATQQYDTDRSLSVGSIARSSSTQRENGVTSPDSPADSSIVVATQGRLGTNTESSFTSCRNSFWAPSVSHQAAQHYSYDHNDRSPGDGAEALSDHGSGTSVATSDVSAGPDGETLSLLRFAWVCEGDELYCLDPCADTSLPTYILRSWVGTMSIEHSSRPTSSEELHEQCRRICRNTERPISLSGMTVTQQDVIDLAAPQNLRWEVVGVVLSAIGLAAIRAKKNGSLYRSILEESGSLEAFSHTILQACNMCQLFMNEERSLNEIYICSTIGVCALHRSLGHQYAAWLHVTEIQNVVARTLSRPDNIFAAPKTFHTQLWSRIWISLSSQDKIIGMGCYPYRSIECSRHQQDLSAADQDDPKDVEWVLLRQKLSRVQERTLASSAFEPAWIEVQSKEIEASLAELHVKHKLYADMYEQSSAPFLHLRLHALYFELLVTDLRFRIQQCRTQLSDLPNFIYVCRRIVKHVIAMEFNLHRYPHDMVFLVGRPWFCNDSNAADVPAKVAKYGMLSAVVAATAMVWKCTPQDLRRGVMEDLCFLKRCFAQKELSEGKTFGECSECQRESQYPSESMSSIIQLGSAAIDEALNKFAAGDTDSGTLCTYGYALFHGDGAVLPSTLFDWLMETKWPASQQ